MKEDEDKMGESGQEWAGFSLQGYCFFGIRTTCLLRRVIEPKMKRHGQMDMGGPWGQYQTIFLSRLNLKEAQGLALDLLYVVQQYFFKGNF